MPAWRNLFNLLLNRSIISDSLIPLEFSHLLSPFNLQKKLIIWLIKLVLVILIEILFLIIHPCINGVQKLILVLFKPSFQWHSFFIIVAIQSKLGISGLASIDLVLGLGELNIHLLAHARSNIMHWVWMVNVRSIDHIFDVSFVLVPHVLLLHNFLEGIGEILFTLGLDHLVKSRIQRHNWIFFLVQLIF